METSKTIAGLIGPTLIAIGAALLVNTDVIQAFAEEIARARALIFLSGVLLLVAGLAIVRAHNIWSGGWPVLVTVLGWIAILSGLTRMFFTNQVAMLLDTFAHSNGLMIASVVILLTLGGFLSFKAYARD